MKAGSGFLLGLMALLSPTLANAEWVQGEIRRLDRENARLTIRHNEIKSMDMPPMTMVFYVKDVSLLNGIQVNETIEFQATVDGKKYIVTGLRRPGGSP